MTRTPEDVWRLLQQASAMPYGPGQIAAVEQVIRHADALGEPHLAFAARIFATQAYVYGGEPAKSFVTFSWCLADFDQNPAPYHQRHVHSLLWFFKYMVSALLKFPEVPLDRTYAVLDDMERRYRDGGHSLHAVYAYRHRVARHIGAEDEAEEWYRRWIAAPRDDLSDCAGCDPSAQASYLASTGRDEEAIALAEPVLGGQLSCWEQPQGILTTLLMPYLRTGRRDAARDAHRRAYRRHRASLADMSDVAEHISFCAVTGNDVRGLEMVERHLDWLDRAPSPKAAMDFAAASALVLNRLAAAGHGDLTVHRRAYGERPAADVPVADLAAEFTALATEVAARFDLRNGTSAQSQRVARLLSAEPIGEYLPLSATAPRRQPVPAPRRVEQHAAVPSRDPAGGAPGAVEQQPVIPPEADAAELLALAEHYDLVEDYDALTTVLAEFDARFTDAELPLSLLAQRTEFRGDERYRADDLSGAEEEWRRAGELYRSCGEELRAWTVTGRLGVLLCKRGAAEEGLRMVESSTTYLDGHADPRRRAMAHQRLGLALLILERFDEALTAYDRADGILTEAFGDIDEAESPVAHVMARGIATRAQILQQLDRLDEFRAAAAAAREVYRRIGPVERLVVANLIYAQSLDTPADAVDVFDEAVRLSGARDIAVDARLGRARALVAAGRNADAIDEYVEVIGMCAERGIEDGAAFVRFELAHAYFHAGRALEAAEAGEEALLGLIKVGDQAGADHCRQLLAEIYVVLEEHESALEMLDQLAENLDGPDNLPGRGRALEKAGDLLYRIDRDALAAERFAAAAEAYRLAGAYLDELRALRRWAVSLHWAGEPDAAVAALEQADKAAAALPAEVSREPEAVWEQAMLGYEAGQVLIGADRLDEALARVANLPDRFRSVDAFGEATQAEVLYGEVLLRLDRPGEAEPVLRSALAGLPRDFPGIDQAAWLLARALFDLGREEEANAVLVEYGLTEDE